MAINASSEAIGEMVDQIRRTISDITRISEGIRGGLSRTGGSWDDDKAQEFADVMNNIASLTETPVDTLEGAIPKLQQLQSILEGYSSTSIGG